MFEGLKQASHQKLVKSCFGMCCAYIRILNSNACMHSIII